MARRHSRNQFGHRWHDLRYGGTEEACASCRTSGPRHWQVAAPYKQKTPLGSGRKPWGVVHLRKEGTGQSACGLPAASWFVFWGHEFKPEDPDTCRDCVRAYAAGAPA